MTIIYTACNYEQKQTRISNALDSGFSIVFLAEIISNVKSYL